MVRHRKALLVAAAVAAPLAGRADGALAQENCRDPVFSTHWAGKSDIVHLGAKPTMQYDLNLCPIYNGRVACCSAAFESEQESAFQHWVEHWRRTRKHLHDFQMEMEGLKVSRAYVQVDFEEKALFDKGFETFNVVLDAFGTCFDTLLEFMAGVLCFACDPHWQDKVVMNAAGTKVLSLRIHDSSYEELWQSCRGFAAAADNLLARIGDSSLAKSITTSFVDLSMFTSRVGLAEYMARQAVLPMHGPNENVLHIEPEEAVIEGTRRLQQQQQPALDDPEVADLYYAYPVRDGRASGFKCTVFPRKPIALGAGAGQRRGSLPVLLAVGSVWLPAALVKSSC